MLPGVSLDFRDQRLMSDGVRVILRQDPGRTSCPGALHQTTTHPVVCIDLRENSFFHLLSPFKCFLLIGAIVALKTY